MSQTVSADAPAMSAYTLAMARCLAKSDAGPGNSHLVHSVTNLVQGRLLEFLAAEISRAHQITDVDSRQTAGHGERVGAHGGSIRADRLRHDCLPSIRDAAVGLEPGRNGAVGRSGWVDHRLAELSLRAPDLRVTI